MPRIEIPELNYVLRPWICKSNAVRTKNLCYQDAEIIEIDGGYILRNPDDLIIDQFGEAPAFSLTEVQEALRGK